MFTISTFLLVGFAQGPGALGEIAGPEVRKEGVIEAAGDSDQALDFLRRMELVGYVPTVRPAGPTPGSAILAVVVLRL